MKLVVTLIFVSISFLFAAKPHLDHYVAATDQAAGGQGGGAKQTLPGKMVFDDLEKKFTIYAGDKGKAPFDHAQHVRVKEDKCVTCHHTNSTKLTEAMEEPVAKCSVCHKLEETVSQVEGTREGQTFKGKKSMNSEDAFHGGPRGSETIVGCIGCHKERDIQPKTCNRCHSGLDQ